ncbi:hypothetical protein [Tamilnaduibacter salinus]|uniref:hypothetical protein n=1 Tax=Tamilnaduibacter salinus TaxID=1484056 RepID=UPI00117F625A|nr:hypothetical protein [Tamilnaduibacter salinus]
MNDLESFAGIAGAISLLLGLLSFFFLVTFAFKRIEEAEAQLATPGKQLHLIRSLWGNGFIGRWMRAVHVCHFFTWRALPVIGPKIASRMGDELKPLPKSLKAWVVVPVWLTTFFLAGFMVFGCILLIVRP